MLSALLTGLIVSLTACGSGGGGGGSVAKQNNLPQVACSASFGGGGESSGTISYNPPLSPTALGYLNQFIYYDNRPSAVSYLVVDYWDTSGNWNTGGSIIKPTPVYAISGGTGADAKVSIPPANQWPGDVCSYMGSAETYTSNSGVVPDTVNYGIMAWKNCSASITNGVMTFNANYEFYLNDLNTAPVKSGTVTFTCNNIKDGGATSSNSTSAKISQTMSDIGMYDYFNSLRDKYAQILN